MVVEHSLQGVEDLRRGGVERALAPRALLLLAIFLTISLVVTVRLVAWQLAENASVTGAPIAQAAEKSRGRIVDSNGLLLATDRFVWEVYAKPGELQHSGLGPELTTAVAQILGLPTEAVQKDLTSTLSLVTVAKDVTEAQCKAVEELQHPNIVWCEPRHARIYPLGLLGVYVIGFADYDQRGVAGAEYSYDNWLRSTREWPADRRPAGPPEPLPDAWQLYLPSSGGRDLVLYLNAALQYTVEKRLAEAIKEYQAETGTIIVMDPRTGGILALANLPNFDPNQYSTAKEELWGNPAVRDAYEPGSVFKVITYAAALDSGRITPDTTYRDPGSLTVSGRTVRNAEGRAYGTVTARQALAKSINVVAAQLCLEMGAETFYRYVRQFGFGKPTEIDQNYENDGIVKTPSNRYWSPYDQAANSFGQGISVTALQMLNAVAAIANQGTLLQPQVAQGLIKDGQIYHYPPRVLRQVIKPETAQTLTEMMVFNVENSSTAELVPGYRVAGKTGTAEIPTEKGYTSKETITSFVGFLPAANPQIVVLVKLAKPQRSRWAERVAVPVFGQVAQDAVRILRIPPDDTMP